jgi:hypothetical protein
MLTRTSIVLIISILLMLLPKYLLNKKDYIRAIYLDIYDIKVSLIDL